VVTVIIIFVPPSSINLLFVLSMLWPLGWGPTVPLLWVMIADVADYSEWKNSRRATGFIYAGILFALKAGLGFRRRTQRVAPRRLRLRPERGPDPARAPRHPPLRDRLLRRALRPRAHLPRAYPIGRELGATVQRELAERRAVLSAT
jgi:GPH family glycoside/pentoside/hexuronide:cation symporter